MTCEGCGHELGESMLVMQQGDALVYINATHPRCVGEWGWTLEDGHLYHIHDDESDDRGEPVEAPVH